MRWKHSAADRTFLCRRWCRCRRRRSGKYTDWPVGSYSIKYLAQYLGFSWRDKTPSGALSIQWFNEYIETKDPQKLERILLYNEDDCKATMVLKDGIKKLSDNFEKKM